MDKRIERAEDFELETNRVLALNRPMIREFVATFKNEMPKSGDLRVVFLDVFYDARSELFIAHGIFTHYGCPFHAYYCAPSIMPVAEFMNGFEANVFKRCDNVEAYIGVLPYQTNCDDECQCDEDDGVEEAPGQVLVVPAAELLEPQVYAAPAAPLLDERAQFIDCRFTNEVPQDTAERIPDPRVFWDKNMNAWRQLAVDETPEAMEENAMISKFHANLERLEAARDALREEAGLGQMEREGR